MKKVTAMGAMVANCIVGGIFAVVGSFTRNYSMVWFAIGLLTATVVQLNVRVRPYTQRKSKKE